MRVSMSSVKVVVKPDATVLHPQMVIPKTSTFLRLCRSAYQPKGMAKRPLSSEKE